MPTTKSSADTAGRIYSLDLLRGLASFSVCWFHLTSFHYPSADGPIYHLVRQSGAYGWLGVEVFFVISGFVIPYSLNRAGYKLSAYPTFILKRILRLDPPYLVSIVLILILAYAYAFLTARPVLVENEPVGLIRVLLHLGYLNMFFNYSWLNPSYWTLAIEFQYYLLVGLCFPLLANPKKLVRWVVLSLFGVSSFFTGHELLSEGVPYSPFISYFALLFVMGILTFQRHAGLIKNREFIVQLTIASALSVVTLGVLTTLVGLFAVAIIIFYNRRNTIAHFLGNISYSLYLLHWPVGHLTLSLVGSKFLNATSDGVRILVLLFALGVCLLSSYILYLLVEKPAQRWSSSIRYGSRRKRTVEEVSGLAATSES